MQKKLFRRQLLSAVMLVIALACLFLFSNDTETAISQSLKFCADVLIPSLFPFMVISSLMVRFRAADVLCRPLSGWFCRLFRLPSCACSAFFLGAICGFPVGAKTAAELYEKGDLTKREAERLAAVSNNTGPSFIVEVIGAFYWNNRIFGIYLYCIQLLSALLLGRIYSCGERLPLPAKEHETHFSAVSPGKIFAEAVSSSAYGMLGICGFVSFFQAILAILYRILSAIGAEAAVPFAASVLEFSSGSAEAALLGGAAGAFLCGFTVGWSGISVFAQSSLFMSSAGLSLCPMMQSKAIQGLICAAAAVLWRRFTGLEAAADCSISRLFPGASIPFTAEILLLLSCWLFPAIAFLSGKPSEKAAHVR